MAESPANELKIVSVTEFNRSYKDDQWYWTTLAANQQPVSTGGEGYKELRKALAGFAVSQGGELSASFSKLVKVSDREYHLRRYALGAPDPFDAGDPLALATEGWQPPEAQSATAQ
ncbi:gp74 [Mycobacterium phage Barnyard]|uniref:DUF1508 domain-containing protein n=1 Tax=Mycobacterium phage Barnyard TaxID=205880 RepID=Q855Z8_9CAUD|nr:gp74 [Mycobacterium phage Barnyard]AAN02128.1 hypothetical protein PBI_BARNYARD_74 [Mycobacterium phage Barnyard]